MHAPQVEHISDLLTSNRLVTLRGEPGSGKSTLAEQVGACISLNDGATVTQVDVAEVDTPDFLADIVADALRAHQLVGTAAATSYLSAIGPLTGPHLLVLDNCDAMLDRVGAVARWLIRRYPRLRILVTCSVPLAVDGEVTYCVTGFGGENGMAEIDARSDAVALMAERASARLGRALHETEMSVCVEVAQAARGVPLALVVAADLLSRIGAERLAAQLSVDRGSSVIGITGQRSILASRLLDLQVQLLSNGERATLTRAAVFVGSFLEDDAVAVCSDDVLERRVVASSLRSLSALGLMTHTEDGCYRVPRYLRRHLDQTTTAVADGQLRLRYITWMRQLAESEGAAVLVASRRRAALCRLERVLPDVRAAYYLALNVAPEEGLLLCAALWAHCALTYRQEELLRRLRYLLSHASRHPTLGRAKALTVLGLLAGDVRRDLQCEARASSVEAIEIAATLPYEPTVGWIIAFSCCELALQAEDTDAELLLERALQAGRSYGDGIGELRAATDLAELRLRRGDADGAYAAASSAVAIAAELESDGGGIKASFALANAQVQLGELAEARRSFEECAEAARAMALWHYAGASLWELFTLADHLDDVASMSAYADELVALSDARLRASWWGPLARGRALIRSGHLDMAVQHLRRALRFAVERKGARPPVMRRMALSTTTVLSPADGLAEAELQRGNIDAACEWLRVGSWQMKADTSGRRSLREARLAHLQGGLHAAEAYQAAVVDLWQPPDRRGLPDALFGLGSLYVLQGRSAPALTLFSAAERNTTGRQPAFWLMPSQRPTLEEEITRARSALGTEASSRAWILGQKATSGHQLVEVSA